MSSNEIAAQIYKDLVHQTLLSIKALPQNELSYYMTLLVAAIENDKNPEHYQRLLKDLSHFAESLGDFYKSVDAENAADKLAAITARLNTLLLDSQIKTIPKKIQKILLNIVAFVTALVGGVIGGLVGTTLGLFSQINFFKGAALGLLAGLAVGITIGFRIPGKVVLDNTAAKFEFILNSMQKVTGELAAKTVKLMPELVPTDPSNPYHQSNFNVYQNKTKQYILDVFFKDAADKEKAFKDFLNSTQRFQVISKQAGYVGGNLKGTAGHHLMIRFAINGIYDIPMEFGVRSRTPKWVDQAETERQVPGQKLFEMLVLDRVLQETHTMDVKFEFESFQAGDNDCLTYVDKILIGTGQAPTQMRRFAPEIDTWVGNHLVRNLFGFFRKTSENELDVIASEFADDHCPEISVYK